MMPDRSPSLGEQLRRYRLAASLSQEELATRTGLAAKAISALERGERQHPYPQTVRSLVEGLGLTGHDRDAFIAAVPGRREARSAVVTSVPSGPRHNLPVALSSFVGRAAETAALQKLVAAERLVTLTGAGGGGKTRLALHVAEGLVDSFADGVWLVELASLADPLLVATAVARVFDVREQAQRPLVETLAEYLRPLKTLVILDNCEHLADACADLVARLLRSSPGLSILATSRQPLQVNGEAQWPVPPLATPEPVRELVGEEELVSRLPRYDAISLFVERARAVDPEFTLTARNAGAVAGICRRLDGLPLAIELAAARLPALPPQAMLDRMAHCLPLLTGGRRDAPARQQTLRNTIAWSYDLLSPDEQVLFRRLAVFRGCSIEAIDAVCAAQTSQPGATSIVLRPLKIDVFDGIVSLVEKSLLRQVELPDGQPWYVMLETVREFAQERLTASDESDVIQRRHVLHYLTLAEMAEREVVGPREEISYTRIDQEHDNLRAALECCVIRGYVDPGFRLALALWWFWMLRGHITEGRARFAALFGRFPLRDRTGRRAADRAKALHAAGTLASIQGDFAAARSFQSEGFTISRELGDLQGASSGLEGLVVIATMQGDYQAARAYADECLAIARMLGDKEMIGHALNASAHVLDEQGDYSAARQLAEESIQVLREAGSPRQVAGSQLTLGVVMYDLGDYAAAKRSTEDALSFVRQHGDRRGEALALANLGRFASASGDFAAAQRRLAESLTIQRDRADPAGIAFVLERFAAVAATQGQHVRAIALAGAAAACRDAVGSPLPPGSQAKLDDRLTSARAALGKPATAEAWATGRALALERAIDLALRAGDGDVVEGLAMHSYDSR